MKILHVYKDYYPVLGGIENHIKWQAEGMRARGHDVQVLVTNTAPHTVQEEIGAVTVTKSARQLNVSSAPISAPMPLHLHRLGRNADIVHLHAPYPPGELSQLLVDAGQRTVLTYHSDIVKQATLLKLYAPFLRRILQRADRILVSNPPYIESSPFLRPFSHKVRVLHFGIDLARFAPTARLQARADQLRCQYGPGPLLLFVGRLRYYKGVEVLIRAMQRVPEARCLIVGTGPLERQTRALVTELGLVDRVRLVGNLPDADLPAVYQAADLFVLPSIHRSESLGIVLLEAMASGLPLISTELGTGTSYVNQHEHTGLVVPAGDVEALVQAIQHLLHDPAQRQYFGRAARERARQAFGLKQMLDRTEAVYAELLG